MFILKLYVSTKRQDFLFWEEGVELLTLYLFFFLDIYLHLLMFSVLKTEKFQDYFNYIKIT